jgi:hypothetical protein
MVGASTVLLFGSVLAFLAFGVKAGQVPWPALVGVIVVFGATEWFFFKSTSGPTLKADALNISSVQPLLKQRMQRADLESIFRGQLFAQTRSGSYWFKSYLFVTPDGKIGIKLSASDFTADGMAEFAQRLQVSMRGDFTLQVKDRVEPPPS